MTEERKTSPVTMGCAVFLGICVLLGIVGAVIGQADQGRATGETANRASQQAAAGTPEDQSAVAAKAKERKAKRAALLAKLKKKRDDVANVTFYSATETPVLGTRFGLYISVADDGSAGLRGQWQYQGDDWLFIQRMRFNIDGKALESVEYPNFRIEHENSSGTVWERYDEQLGAAGILLFRTIAGSKKSVARFEGKSHYHDHVFTDAEKRGFTKVLDAWAQFDEAQDQH